MSEPSPSGVRCGTCDTPFNDETLANLPIEVKPACPNCGSKARIISLTFAVSSSVSPQAPANTPLPAREAIPSEHAELVFSVRVMQLSEDAFSVEITDVAGGDSVAAIGLSADDLALGIAEDIVERIQAASGP
jgi:DNA-directed RNA polymerase subunit RPC12/RpoP